MSNGLMVGLLVGVLAFLTLRQYMLARHVLRAGTRQYQYCQQLGSLAQLTMVEAAVFVAAVNDSAKVFGNEASTPEERVTALMGIADSMSVYAGVITTSNKTLTLVAEEAMLIRDDKGVILSLERLAAQFELEKQQADRDGTPF